MEYFELSYPGKSGQLYTFEAYPIGIDFKPISGVYIFCREVATSEWEALYVGEAQSFHDRLYTGLSGHDGFKRASRVGATHVAAMPVNGKTNRLRVETDLRHGLNPQCNLQGNTILSNLYR